MLREHPIFDAFRAKALSQEEATKATPAERIASIWPFVVTAVQRFQKTLKAREKANWDAEDVCVELFVKLLQKDGKWVPARAKYITFASKIVSNELYAIRDLARTVHSPRNSCHRMKQMERQEQDTGTLSPVQSRTLEAIRSSSRGSDSFDALEHDDGESPDDPLLDQETRSANLKAVMDGVCRISPYEAVVVGSHFGLFGQRESSVAEIATKTGKSQLAVRVARDSALRKLRDHLELSSVKPKSRSVSRIDDDYPEPLD